jgi:hypothetical protein
MLLYIVPAGMQRQDNQLFYLYFLLEVIAQQFEDNVYHIYTTRLMLDTLSRLLR